jgi:hypothetical protein
MDYTILIYTILGIMLVITIVLVVMWSLSIQTVPTYAPAPQYTQAGYGTRCSMTTPPTGQNSPDQFPPQTCEEGLVCISATNTSTGFCFKDIGTACTSILECVPQAIVCNGYCSSTAKFGLGITCSFTSECDTGLICDPSLSVCLGNVGYTCSSSADCSSRTYCDTTCQLLAAPGQVCTFIDNEATCDSGYDCSTSNPDPSVPTIIVYPHFCQPSGISTGTLSALCFLWSEAGAPPVTDGGFYENVSDGSGGFAQVPICAPNTQCNIVRDGDGIPISAPIIGFGLCSSIGNWGGSCSTTNGCQTPQVCVESVCQFPIEQSGLNAPLSCDMVHTTGVCLDNLSVLLIFNV